MRLTHLEVTDHRNISHAELHPDPHLTVLCGPNGQGKTNLLEAVWLLTGGKSFRGSKDAELIRRGCDFSVIEGAFETQDVEKSIRLTVGSRQSQRPGRQPHVPPQRHKIGPVDLAQCGIHKPPPVPWHCWLRLPPVVSMPAAPVRKSPARRWFRHDAQAPWRQ